MTGNFYRISYRRERLVAGFLPVEILPEIGISGNGAFDFALLLYRITLPIMENHKLSDAAIAQFRLHVDRMGQIDVDDSNREAYVELEQAGLVMNSRPFAGNQLYSLTRKGFEKKVELSTHCSPTI